MPHVSNHVTTPHATTNVLPPPPNIIYSTYPTSHTNQHWYNPPTHNMVELDECKKGIAEIQAIFREKSNNTIKSKLRALQQQVQVIRDMAMEMQSGSREHRNLNANSNTNHTSYKQRYVHPPPHTPTPKRPTAFHPNFNPPSTIKSTRLTAPTPQRGPGTYTQNGKSYQKLSKQAQYHNKLRTVHHHCPTATLPTYTNATSSSTGPVRENYCNNLHPTTASAPLVSPVATTTVRNPYKRPYTFTTTVRNPYLKKKW